MTENQLRAQTFIKDLTVVYGDDSSQIPENAVSEVDGLSADINSGFGGSYVWLVPEYVADTTTAAVGWDVIIQKDADPSLSDLAKGAGGSYRYLRAMTDTSQQDAKVASVSLVRLNQATLGVPAGWNGVTIDINKGRGGTYLYLVWKTSA